MSNVPFSSILHRKVTHVGQASITFLLPAAQKAEVDRFAEALGCYSSDIFRELVAHSLPEFRKAAKAALRDQAKQSGDEPEVQLRAVKP